MPSTPKSFIAFCTPAQADWLNDLSFTPPVSVTRPTLRTFFATVAVAAGAAVVAVAAGAAVVAVGWAAGAVVGAATGAVVAGAAVGVGPQAPSTSTTVSRPSTNSNFRFRMRFSS